MRAISACFLFAVAASLVTAQTCVAPSTNLFAAPANCVAANTCKSALCACTGSSAAYPTCLSTNTGSCTATQACYASYTSCIMSIVATRSNTSDACSTFGANLYIAQLAAAASTTLTFNTTSLAVSCSYNACSLMNQTRNTGSCVLNSITTAVCSSANLVGSTTTTVVPTPTPTATNATNYTGYDLVFTLRISGSSWSVLLQNAATKAQTITALTADLAKLWGIDAKWIVIQSLDVGSLVAGVGVLQGSGFSPLQLALVISATQNTGSWLTSLQAVYSTVSGETLITLAVTITVTAAPTTITPVMTLTPPTAAPVVSSAVNVARVWAAAALSALCLALWA